MKKPILFTALLIVSLLLNLTVAVIYINRHFFKKRKSETDPHYIHTKVVNSPSSRWAVFEGLPVGHDDIIFAGDSHTLHFRANEYFPGISIKNRGIGGDYTSRFMKRLYQFTTGNPKQIFIEIGVNDLRMRVTTDSLVKNLNSIADTIRLKNPNTDLKFVSIFPVNRHISNDSIALANTKIKQLCENRGLTFIDLHKRFVKDGHLNEKYDSGDGIHLNSAGYKAWADVISPYITNNK